MARAAVLAVVVVCGFFAFINGVGLAFVPVYGAALVVPLSLAWSWWAERHLTLSRTAPDRHHMVGELFPQQFTLSNTSWLPIAMAEVVDRSGLPGGEQAVAASLGPHQRATWGQELRLTTRGQYRLGPTEVRVSDPFGLFPRTVSFPATGSVLVFPLLYPLSDLALVGARAGLESERGGRPRDLPPSASGVREHDPADGINRIHWISTARQGRLMSRTFDAEEGADLLVVLDLRRGIQAGTGPESSLEYAVTMAASLAHAALRRGRAVALLGTGRSLTWLPAARGDAQEQLLLEKLALCQADGQVPLGQILPRHLPEWRSRGSVVVVTSDPSGEWVEAVAASSQPGRRAVAIFVDPMSFAPQPTLTRIPAQWRLVLDFWVIRQGDDLARVDPSFRRAVG